MVLSFSEFFLKFGSTFTLGSSLPNLGFFPNPSFGLSDVRKFGRLVNHWLVAKLNLGARNKPLYFTNSSSLFRFFLAISKSLSIFTHFCKNCFACLYSPSSMRIELRLLRDLISSGEISIIS